jgi:PKD repeat protein
MTWGPVGVTTDDLVTLFSFDESVVQSLEKELKWKGLKLGEATVRVMPRGPGKRSMVLSDWFCMLLGCNYHGGAFGDDMPESSVKVIVGQLELTATPHQGSAPLTTTFSWTGLKAQEEPLTCILDVGDGSTFYTIHDCANTTTQTHSYPYASALQSASGSYEAELKVVDTERTARADVLAEWSFSATPSQGKAPLEVTFSWGGFDPEGGAFSCRLEPGDGSPVQTIDDCLSTTTATHRYREQGGYTATLIVVGALRQDFKSVPVTVTEESAGCEGIENVESWTGTVTMNYSRSGQRESSSVSVERQANITVALYNRGEAASSVWWNISATGGSASIHDISTRVAPGGTYRDEIKGNGAPLPNRSGGLSVRKGSCMISRLEVIVHIEAQNDTVKGVAMATIGIMKLHDIPLSGSASLPVSNPYQGSDIGVNEFILQFGASYVEGFAHTLADHVGRDNLGTADVSWSFTPAE